MAIRAPDGANKIIFERTLGVPVNNFFQLSALNSQQHQSHTGGLIHISCPLLLLANFPILESLSKEWCLRGRGRKRERNILIDYYLPPLYISPNIHFFLSQNIFLHLHSDWVK